MKVRASTKIFIGFIVVLAAIFGGRALWTRFAVGNATFAPLKPGTVNIVGVDTRAGYHIIVANRIAQLVLGGSGEFAADGNRDPGAEDSVKKRVPIREMLSALQGDTQALSVFVMKLNDIDTDDAAAATPVWKIEDLRKAFEGDASLRQKLENDLNMRVDGTPLDYVRQKSIENGILIDFPVPVTVKPRLGGPETHLTARVQEGYIPRLAKAVHARYKEKSPTASMIKGYYIEEAKKVLESPAEKENVKSSIESRVRPDRVRQLAEVPEQILSSIEIIVNSDFMSSAQIKKHEVPEGRPYYDLEIDLNSEGRDRLWKYSVGRVGTQLLLVWRGIAVAAPRIDHELAEPQVTITPLEDEGIAQETADAIMKRAPGDKNP